MRQKAKFNLDWELKVSREFKLIFEPCRGSIRSIDAPAHFKAILLYGVRSQTEVLEVLAHQCSVLILGRARISDWITEILVLLQNYLFVICCCLSWASSYLTARFSAVSVRMFLICLVCSRSLCCCSLWSHNTRTLEQECTNIWALCHKYVSLR